MKHAEGCEKSKSSQNQEAGDGIILARPFAAGYATTSLGSTDCFSAFSEQCHAFASCAVYLKLVLRRRIPYGQTSLKPAWRISGSMRWH